MTRSMEYFNKFIEELDLVDLPLSNGNFTWSDGRELSVLSLIDRFLVNRSWLHLFKDARVTRLARIISDHFPVALETGSFKWGPMPFKFENMWLHHINFLPTLGLGGGAVTWKAG